jgi:hypothetical protein
VSARAKTAPDRSTSKRTLAGLLARYWEPWGLLLVLLGATALLQHSWLNGQLPWTPRQEGLSVLRYLDGVLRELRAGHGFPSWDPREFDGFPWRLTMSWTLYLVMALPAWLLHLPSTTVLKVVQFAGFAGSGLGMYLYLRTVLGARRPAIVAALAYMWLPTHAFLGAEVDIHSPVWAILPLILYAEERSLRAAGRVRWRWTVAVAVLAALLAVVSSEYALLSAPALVIYFLLREALAVRRRESDLRGAALRLAVVGAVALGLAAFFVVPMLAATPTVGIQDKHGAASTFTSDLVRGYAVTPSMVVRAIAKRTHLPLPVGELPRMFNALWAVAWYPGLLAPLLGLLGLWALRRSDHARLALVLLLVTGLQAAGGLVPGNPFSVLPVLRNLFPFRSLMQVLLFACILIGFGAQWLLARLRGGWRPWATAALAVLLIVDLLPSTQAFQAIASYQTAEEQAGAQWLAAHLAPGERVWEPIMEPRDEYRVIFSDASGNARFGGYYDNGAPLYTWELLRFADLGLALRLSNVRYAIIRPAAAADADVQHGIAAAGMQPVDWGVPGLALYAAPVQPYAQSWAAVAVSNPGAGRADLAPLPALAERNIALVSGDAPTDLSQAGYAIAGGTAGDLPAAAAPQAVEWTRPRPEEIRLQTDLAAPGVVSVAEAWYPSWRVSIDGRPATLLRVNYAFLGVWAPAGKHEVVLTFGRTPAENVGAAISVVTLLVLVGVWAWGVRSRKAVAVK